MSVLSPPRPTAPPAPPRHLVEERPLRYPDTGSRAVMTRRGWWLVILNFLMPGSAQAVAGNRRLAKVGLGSTLALWIVAIARPPLRAAVAARCSSLSPPTGSCCWPPRVCSSRTRCCGSFSRSTPCGSCGSCETGSRCAVRDRHRGRRAHVRLERLGGVRIQRRRRRPAARSASIFGASGPSVPPSDGYYNILLLGADSGVGRDSMRFDSISVVSVNATTGATTITGIPRDMPHFPFAPGPMQDEYPNGHEGHANSACGWGSGINQLRTEVEVCQDGTKLYPDAVAQGSEPGIEATKDAAEGDPRHQDPVLRLHRHARLRIARRRARRRRHHGDRARCPRAAVPRTKANPPRSGRSGGSSRVRSTWTATLLSGTPVRATRRPTSTA